MQIEEYIVDIIRKEMNLDQQNIWIYSQNRKIPPQSQELYVTVGCVDFLPISSKSRYNPDSNTEIQTVYGRASVQVDILSRSREARIRRAELLMALNSYYSKEVQDKHQFRIFELPARFLNTSSLEGGSEINRFSLVIRAMISEDKIKETPYYDQFSGNIWAEDSDINNIELNDLQIEP